MTGDSRERGIKRPGRKVQKSVKGRGGIERITEITEGVEWKGEGRKVREVEISRRIKKS